MGMRFGTVTLAVGIGAGALAGVAIGAPILASAAGTSTPSATSPGTPSPGTAPSRPDRLAELRTALKSLVADGTITQAQADKIAARLDQSLPRRGDGPGGFHGGMHGMRGLLRGGLDAAAKALGMTSDQVRTGLASGKSLAQLAQDKGVAQSKVVDAITAEVTADVDQAVKDGRMSSDLGTKIKSDLKSRIADLVKQTPPTGGPMDRGGFGGGPRFGGGGFGGEGFDGGPGPGATPSGSTA